MKRIQILLLVFFALMSCDCDEDNAPETFKLGVDVQASFENDFVNVTIDSREIVNENVSTNHLLGVTEARKVVDIDRGEHIIRVIINGTETKNESFSVTREKYIGVGLNTDSGEITILYSDQPFGYD
jgi:hypothetical protein